MPGTGHIHRRLDRHRPRRGAEFCNAVDQPEIEGRLKMSNSNQNPSQCHHKNRLAVFFAAILIALGLVLQWTELLFTRFLPNNGWLFATLLGEIWNIISISPSGTQWHQNLNDWPLLLVITGAAILFSCSRRKFRSN
jgi:hypothetical protein